MATKKPLGLYAGEVEGFAVGDFVDITNGGTGAITKTAGFDNLSPTTTKGDLIVNNGTTNIRIGAGTNGMVLTADSSTINGVKWATPTGGSSGTTVTGMLKGDGTNILLAIADLDYVTPSALQDLENAYRLADNRVAEEASIKNLTGFPDLGDNSRLFLTKDNVSTEPRWTNQPVLSSVNFNSGVFYTATVTNDYNNNVSYELRSSTTGLLKAAPNFGTSDNLIDVAIAGTDYVSPSSNRLIPAGGTTGQVLGKFSATDYDLMWVTTANGSVKAFSYNASIGYNFDTDKFVNKVAQKIVIGNTNTLGYLPNGLMIPLTPGVNIVNASIGYTNLTYSIKFDELEFTPLVCHAYVSAQDEITLLVVSTNNQPFSGNYTINFFIG